jgi:high-affinity nickel permease
MWHGPVAVFKIENGKAVNHFNTWKIANTLGDVPVLFASMIFLKMNSADKTLMENQVNWAADDKERVSIYNIVDSLFVKKMKDTLQVL